MKLTLGALKCLKGFKPGSDMVRSRSQGVGVKFVGGGQAGGRDSKEAVLKNRQK